MTYERTYGGQTPAQRDNRKSNNRPSSASARRAYPGADYATSQLVTKLRARSSEGQKLNRINSAELMQDAYKTMPRQPASPRTAQTNARHTTNVREVPAVIDNKYSPYSNVNVAAVNEAKKHEARTAPVRANSPARRPATAVKNAASVQTRTAPVKKSSAPAPAEVKFRRYDTTGQLAESGPREVAYKRVPFPKLALMILMLSLIFFLMVHSIMRNFEYQREIEMLQSELDSLSDRAEELRLELEERDDLAEIESWAEEIGMIKDASVDEKYISLENSDIIENFGGEDEEYGSFTTMLSAVSRQLSRFLGGE